MPSPDSLKIGITEPGLPEVSVAELEIFRDEIRKLKEEEETKSASSAHFERSGDFSSLNSRDYQIWQSFKLCQQGKLAPEDFLPEFDNYRRAHLGANDDSGELVEYMGNKFAILLGRDRQDSILLASARAEVERVEDRLRELYLENEQLKREVERLKRENEKLKEG